MWDCRKFFRQIIFHSNFFTTSIQNLQNFLTICSATNLIGQMRELEAFSWNGDIDRKWWQISHKNTKRLLRGEIRFNSQTMSMLTLSHLICIESPNLMFEKGVFFKNRFSTINIKSCKWVRDSKILRGTSSFFVPHEHQKQKSYVLKNWETRLIDERFVNE